MQKKKSKCLQNAWRNVQELEEFQHLGSYAGPIHLSVYSRPIHLRLHGTYRNVCRTYRNLMEKLPAALGPILGTAQFCSAQNLDFAGTVVFKSQGGTYGDLIARLCFSKTTAERIGICWNVQELDRKKLFFQNPGRNVQELVRTYRDLIRKSDFSKHRAERIGFFWNVQELDKYFFAPKVVRVSWTFPYTFVFSLKPRIIFLVC